MGALTLTSLVFLIQSSLSQQMKDLRKELDQVALEQNKVQQELLIQEVFLGQLHEEHDKLKPQMKKVTQRLAYWLTHARIQPSVRSIGMLPLPFFDVDRADKEGFSEVVMAELERTYVEYDQLREHWEETEEQLNVAKAKVEAKRSYLSDLRDNLKGKLIQKETFRKRLARSPRLFKRLKSDYKLARGQLDRADKKYKPRHTSKNKETHKLSLPVKGKLFRKFGKHVSARYRTVIKNKGIHLETPIGSEISVVLPGEVVFVGNYGLFGKLVMVRHKDGVRTLYSGFSKVFVERGQSVNYRQVLGLSGHGFGLEYEGVYFEVRRGRRALNPLAWMKRAKKRRR